MLGDMQQAIANSQSQSTTKKPYRLCNHRSGKAFFVLIVFKLDHNSCYSTVSLSVLAVA